MARLSGYLLLLLVVICSVPTALAQAVTIPYPQLLGVYDSTPYALNLRSAPFRPSALVSSISSVSIRWIGTGHPGVIADCATGAERPLWTRFTARLDNSGHGLWFATGALLTDSFDETIPFHYYSPDGTGDLSLLLEDTAELEVRLPPPFVYDCTLVYPTGTLTGCELLIDGVVATESSTWGQIKNIYR